MLSIRNCSLQATDKLATEQLSEAAITFHSNSQQLNHFLEIDQTFIILGLDSRNMVYQDCKKTLYQVHDFRVCQEWNQSWFLVRKYLWTGTGVEGSFLNVDSVRRSSFCNTFSGRSSTTAYFSGADAIRTNIFLRSMKKYSVCQTNVVKDHGRSSNGKQQFLPCGH